MRPVQELYDTLDVIRGVDALLNSFRGASAYAIRRGFLSIGAKDNSVVIFPELMDPKLLFLTANGEASGQLAPMLQRAAEELEREAARRISWFAALLQPALIVTMGAIVLVLVLAVMLPIVAMNQLIR